MEQPEVSCLDYFSAGVPTAEYFRMTLDDLRQISSLDGSRPDEFMRLQELCLVGLMAYFEAFCKDHFASLINIEPKLILNLKSSGQSIDVDSSRLVMYADGAMHRMGFVLAEKYDFGTANKINALFRALLKVTPFGKDDEKRYDNLLRDRNLLVHHGGVFTLSYLEQNKGLSKNPQLDAFFYSRTIKKEDVAAAIEFIGGIAKKLTCSTHASFLEFLAIEKIQYSGERKKAVDYANWPPEDRGGLYG